MDRIELFEKAKVAIGEFLQEFPEFQAAISIDRQLDYLIAVESGVETDRSRLKDIIIGVLTAREIEPGNEAVVDILHEVSSEVPKMISGR